MLASVSKIALVTMFDEAFRDIADRTVPTMRHYADAFNLQFFALSPGAQGRPPSWGKISRICEVLQAGFDYCLYVDADTMFVRFDRDVRDEIDATSDLHLCWHDPENSEAYAPVPGHFNGGVMAWRSSEWSLKFLDDIWCQEGLINHHWWEQAALHNVLGYRSVVSPDLTDCPDLDRLAHVGQLPVNWNAIVGHTVAPDPIIVHFAGRPWPIRLAAIDREIAAQTMRRILPPSERHRLSRYMNLMVHQDFQLHCAREQERAAHPDEIKKQAERLTRTDAALAETQKLAIERYHEIERLSERLDRTHAALAETQNLAIERYHEIERPSAQRGA